MLFIEKPETERSEAFHGLETMKEQEETNRHSPPLHGPFLERGLNLGLPLGAACMPEARRVAYFLIKAT